MSSLVSTDGDLDSPSYNTEPLLKSKDDLTSCSPSANINFDRQSFDQNLSAVISDLNLVNSANHEDPVCNCELEDPNLGITFKAFSWLAQKEVTLKTILAVLLALIT